MSAHLSTEMLCRFLDGKLPSDEESSVVAHVEVCEPCRVRLESQTYSEDTSRSRAVNETATWYPDSRVDAAIRHAARPPQFLGDYEVLEALGTGGFGAVYRGRDRHTGRIVAIKLAHAGAGSEFGERLKKEAETIAKLDHENIVRLFQVGVATSGTLYVVMEFIDGETLSERLARGAPKSHNEIRANVELILHAARGLSVAHGLQILHRDIKPSNILVDRHGCGKLCDFGLALHVGDVTRITPTGVVAGSLHYMSPEQLSGYDLSLSSDVYSLGLVLHYAITGERPYAGANEVIIQRKLSEDPVPPRQLNPRIPRDLETICLRAIERDFKRRPYRSADVLVDRLQRFLNGESIPERPVSRPEMAWRWSRRKPVIAALSAALVVAVILGCAGVFWQWRKAESRRVLADDNARQASAEGKRADANYHKARAAVQDLFTRVASDRLIDQPGMQPLRKELLTLALRYHREFVEQQATLPEARVDVAESLFHIGSIESDIGSLEQARAALREATDRYQSLLDSDPGHETALLGLISVQNNLGNLNKADRKFDAAQACFDRAIAAHSRLPSAAARQPLHRAKLANLHNGLGNLHSDRHDVAAADKSYQEALRLERQLVAELPNELEYQADLARTLVNLGLLLGATDKWEPAESVMLEALELRRRLVTTNADSPDAQSEFALALLNVATIRHQLRKPDEAIVAAQEAARVQRRAVDQNPSVVMFRSDLARIQYNLGNLLRDAERFDEAIAVFEQAAKTQEDVAAVHSSVIEHHRDVARTYNNLARLQWQTGRLADAQRSIGHSVEVRRRLVSLFPEDADLVAELASTVSNQGTLVSASGALDEARDVFCEAVDLLVDLAVGEPDSDRFLTELSGVYSNLGELAHKQGDDAMEYFDRSIRIAASIARHAPDDWEPLLPLGRNCAARASIHQERGESNLAIQWFRTAADHFEHILKESPGHLGATRLLGDCRSHLDKLATRKSQLSP